MSAAAVALARPPALTTAERGMAMACANPGCAECFGRGVCWRTERVCVCACVWRTVFDQVMEHCYSAIERINRGQAELSVHRVPRGAAVYGILPVEYLADLAAVARRALAQTQKPTLYQRLWTCYFLESADVQTCCRRLRIDRGNFWSAVLRSKTGPGRCFRSPPT